MAYLAVVLASAFLVAPVTDTPPAPPGTSYSSYAQDDEIATTAAHSDGGVRPGPGSDEPVLDEYSRDACGTKDAPAYLNGDCSGYADVTPPDCGGDEPLRPLLHRHRDTATSPWGHWSLALGWTCPGDPAAVVFTAADLRRLPIAPSVVHVQPDRPEVLVNKPTIVYTDPTTQTFTPTLLGQVIEVQATPTTYTWDFGDHTDPITTTSPGHPYPDQDTTHPYRSLGTYTITLTTTWTGHYRPAGTTTWLPVTGTATTTTTTGPITAVEAPTHLVSTDCHHTPHAPDC